MSQVSLLPVALTAIVDWIAVAKNWKRVEYLAKPGMVVFLLAWLVSQDGFGGPLIWFAVGIILSLAGDILLLMPPKWFLLGLASFLLAQFSYLAGFISGLSDLNIAALLLFVLVAATGIQVFRRIAASLAQHGQAALRIPVMLYSFAISLMLLSALLTLLSPNWETLPALMVSTGALLFYLSDAFLAWNLFVAPIHNSHIKNIIAYHIGQIVITVGAALHFLER